MRKIVAITNKRFEETIGSVGPDVFRSIINEATREHERECMQEQTNVPSPFGMTRWVSLARKLIELRSQNPSNVSIY